MKTIPIKGSTKATNLRGVGMNKLDYSNRGRVNSTLKRLDATFVDDETPLKGSATKTVRKVCPICKRRVTVRNGKFVQHSRYRYIEDNCKNSNQPIIKK